MTFYLCDGLDKACPKTHCYRVGGPCRHTQKVEHAKTLLTEDRDCIFEILDDGTFWEIEEE